MRACILSWFFVLVHGVGKLLDTALRLAQILGGISQTSVLSVELRLELPDAGLHLGNGLLASLEGGLLSLIKAGLSVLDLGLEQLLVPVEHHGALLLSSELLSQPGGVNHGMLGLVLGHLGLGDHLGQVVTEGVHLGLALALGSLDGLVGAGLLGQSLVGVGQLLLNHPPIPVGLLKESAGLLKSVLVGIDSPVSGDESILGGGLGPDLILVFGLDLADSCLDPLDVSLALGIGSICVLKSNTKVNNIGLQLLLHPESLNLALGLALKLHLHAIDGLGKVLLGGGKLLVLLGQTALDLLPDLGELQGGSEHLVLLLLQGALSLRQSGLKLHLLSLEPLPDFVNLVDRAASLSDLVEDVLDLVGQGLVLAPDLLQLEKSLVIGVLHLEQLGGHAAGLILSTVQIH